MRFALRLAYDGRAFNGWQTQPGGNTVQDHLEAALARIAGAPVRVTCAGRTDTGVHALAQPVHFDAPAPRPLSAWVRGLNSHLPASIAVTAAQAVRQDFHARYDAIGRQYQYLLRVAPVRDPFWAGRAGWVFRSMDVAAMRAGAANLIGTHDFSAFRSAQCQAASPVRRLDAIGFAGSAGLILITFEGNAFLHHMIRNIVGALIEVGAARRHPTWLGELLAGRDRRRAAPTFDASGLYFCGARYPQGDRLPGYARLNDVGHWPGRED